MTPDFSAAAVPLLPELLLGVGAMTLLILGAYRTEEAGRLIDSASVVLLVIAGLIVLVLPEGRLVAFNGSFVVDDFARFLKILAMFGSAAAIVMSLDYARREHEERFEYSVLILLSTLGMRDFELMEIETESTLSPKESQEIVCDFGAHLLSEGLVVKDGDTIGFSPQQLITVRHRRSFRPDVNDNVYWLELTDKPTVLRPSGFFSRLFGSSRKQ